MEKQALAGRYALRERVGSGGMADVYSARDTRLDRDVAIKLFRPGIAGGIDRGSAEARMLAGLDHPGLVRVLDMDSGDDVGSTGDAGDTGSTAYLVMQLVEGPDLGILLRSAGPLAREEVRLLALDLTRTLHYIHGRGIVHRDLKPSNVLTRHADPHSGLFRYLLTDFGIARFFDGSRLTATGQVIGSAAYFSPEQTRGDGVGQPSDIYSLGLVLIEALAGERAFPGTGVESALARLHRSPSIPHSAGPALAALLASMTLDEPTDRPDAACVVQALTDMGPQHDGGSAATTVLSAGAPTTAALRPGVALQTPTAALPPAVAPQRTTAWDAQVPGAGTAPTSSTGAATAATALVRPAGPPTVALGVPDAVHRPGDGHPPAPPRTTSGARPGARRPPGPRRHVLPWLVTLLVVGLLAGALWTFTRTAPEPGPDVQPLPAVPGETGEKLQELYDSVQR